MTKNNILLFSYGVELSLSLLHSTLGGPSLSCLGQAFLPQFSLIWHHSNGLPMLKYKRSSKTYGAITSLSIEQYQKLLTIRSGIYVAQSCVVCPIEPLSISKNSPLSFSKKPLSFSKLTSLLRSEIACQCFFPALDSPLNAMAGTPHPWAWRETIAGAYSRHLPKQWIHYLQSVTPASQSHSYAR